MTKIRRKVLFFHIVLLSFLCLVFSPLFTWGYEKYLESFLSQVCLEIEKELAQEEKTKEYFFHLQDFSGKEKESILPISFYPKFPIFPEKRFLIQEGENRVAIFTKILPWEESPHVLQVFYPLHDLDYWVDLVKLAFFGFGIFLLFLYALFSTWILRKLYRPIRKMLQVIEPYQKGKMEFLSYIILPSTEEKDFEKLASTLNSLSGKVQFHLQALLAQHKENESILESLMEGVVAFNEQGKITYINRTALQMVGLMREEVMGKDLPSLREQTRDILIEESEEIRFYCQKENKLSSKLVSLFSPSKKYVNVIAIPRKKASGVILVLQDKSSDFRVLQMGKDFIANASHEIKTPITVIQGFAETLYDYPKIKGPQQKEILGKIVGMCKRLDSVLRSLLTLNELENSSCGDFSFFDVKLLLENCSSWVSSFYSQVDLSLELSENLWIKGNQDLIEMALMNLIENSIKYSERPTVIFLKAEKQREHVLITIKDQGIGIPKEDLKHIFERFFTVDKARSRKYGGVGLGLSIVKNVVEKHAGKISVSSQVEGGTTFELAFPTEHPSFIS